MKLLIIFCKDWAMTSYKDKTARLSLIHQSRSDIDRIYCLINCSVICFNSLCSARLLKVTHCRKRVYSVWRTCKLYLPRMTRKARAVSKRMLQFYNVLLDSNYFPRLCLGGSSCFVRRLFKTVQKCLYHF